MKTGCLIFSNNVKYNKLHDCAVNSFIKYHQDILIFSIKKDSDIYNELEKFIGNVPAGIQKFIIAHYLFKQFKLNKIIILGADTITCDRLNEFIDDNENDILTTLDYPYQLITLQNYTLSLDKEDHINADVVCFNNIKALESVIETCSKLKTEYYEQGALNYVCNIEKKYKTKIVDGNYKDSDVVYNARAKGNLCAGPNEKPWSKYSQLFNVKNNKLYTGINENISKEKQIKVWHYCEGLGYLNNERFENMINWWIDNGFNQETKKFFSEECNCGDFFKQKFVI